MFFQVAICVSMILISVQGKVLDPGPQVFPANDSTTSPQRSQQSFATKDIIVYLTPSQINDLESGKAELRATSVEQITINKKLPNFQQKPQNQRESYHIENLNILKTPLIHNPSLRINQKSQDFNSNKPEKQLVASNPKFFQPEQQFSKNDRQTSEKWIPFIPSFEKILVPQPTQEQFNKNWQRVLQKNREQLKLISDYQRQLSSDEYAGARASGLEVQRYTDLKNAFNGYNTQEIEQQVPRAEDAKFDFPVIIHKEVKITKHLPIVKHVAEPVPRPLLVAFPEPYEVNVQNI